MHSNQVNLSLTITCYHDHHRISHKHYSKTCDEQVKSTEGLGIGWQSTFFQNPPPPPTPHPSLMAACMEKDIRNLTNGGDKFCN